jgi:hypothetical protein
MVNSQWRMADLNDREARPWEDRILNEEKPDTATVESPDDAAALDAWAYEPGVYLKLDKENVYLKLDKENVYLKLDEKTFYLTLDEDVEESAFSTTVNGSERMFSVGTVTRKRSPSGVRS